MASEVERKYRVKSLTGVTLPRGTEIVQGYLGGEGSTVRVRILGDRAVLSIKCRPPRGGTHASGALERLEFEYPIPMDDARAMLACTARKIEKTRHKLENGIEIDLFHGAMEGFVLAEYESPDGAQAPAVEGLELEEVTSDPRFSNAWMAENGVPKG